MTDALAIADDRSDLAELEDIEQQRTLRVNERSPRRRGHDWGLSPAIERASVLREKPQPEHKAATPRQRRSEVQRGGPVTLESLPPGTLYCVVDNYEALKEAFADRIADLNVPMTEIDAAGGMTRGQTQKCLSKSNNKSWARDFGWESLGKALKGTGMALAFIIDDERFAPIKAKMAQRKLKQQR